jgi:hypothetical protein
MEYKKCFSFFSKRLQAKGVQTGQAYNTEQNWEKTTINEYTVTQTKSVFRIAA